MYVRHVQLTGGSSYIITLPKNWITKYKIKKNDPLGLHVKSDGTLLVTPRIQSAQIEKVKEFNINGLLKQEDLLQLLIGAYIVGYNTLKINSKERLSTSVRRTVKTFTQLAIGPEVIEETDSSITLKDLLNPFEMPIDKVIKRMHIIVKSLYEDTIQAFQTRDAYLVEGVTARDDDVDRLNWFIARQYNILLENVDLTDKLNITIDRALTCFMISRIIERIGDHVVRIAENTPAMLNNKDEKIIDEINKASKLSLEIFNKSIESFFKKDLKSCQRNIESVSQLEIICEGINTRVMKHKGSATFTIGYVTESIRRIGEYSEDISENVINYLVKI